MNHLKQIIFLLLMFSSCSAMSEKLIDSAETNHITVYRSASCGCCHKWVEYLKANQFVVEDNVTDDMAAVKAKFAIPRNLASCHTAVINGYIIEGHVPADAIRKLLEKQPKVKGIAVPGMPIGSPGMEVGRRQDSYQVVSFDENGQFKLFSSYPGNQ